MGLKNRVVKGAIWAMLESVGTQGVQFVVTMVLSRLLTPADYGTVALLSIFIAIAGSLASIGFCSALVQKKDATELDFNSVFYMNLALGVFMYLVLFFMANWIASFYDVPVLKPIVRVAASVLVFNAINSVQTAELNRKMLFHLSFRISILSIMTSGTVGITLAYCGWGVWALVWATFAGGIVGVISRWFMIAWRPKLMFSFSALKPLFRYGWKLAVSGLIDTGYNNLYGLLIGKWYSRADLAFVNKGNALPNLLMNNVNGSLGRVAFPALSQMQGERERLREAMRKMIRTSTFLVFPLMTILAVTAAPVIRMLYGGQWDGAVVYTQLACFSFALWPFHTINLQAIQALGRSDIYLKLELIKKGWGLVMLAICMPRGVFVFMSVSAFITGPFGVIVNSWPNRRLLGYTVFMQVRDVLPAAILCVLVAGVLLLVGEFPMHYIALALVQGCVGAAVYFGLASYFNLESMSEAVYFLRTVLGKFSFARKGAE